MKMCLNCSMRSPESAEHCPNCGTLLVPEMGGATKTEEYRLRRKRDWLWLVFGVPGLMLFLYLIYLAARSFLQ